MDGAKNGRTAAVAWMMMEETVGGGGITASFVGTAVVRYVVLFQLSLIPQRPDGPAFYKIHMISSPTRIGSDLNANLKIAN